MSDTIVRLPPYRVQQTLFAAQLSDRVDWGQRASGLPEAWKLTKGAARDGRRVRVAVLDTGVDKAHLDGDLAGVSHAMDSTGGHDPYDDNGHGTHVLGTLGACADGRGVVGCAPACELLSLKCLVDGVGEGAWVARAIDQARGEGVHVISMSLGSPFPDAEIDAAIDRAVQAGIFVVCAAGNTGRTNDVGYPAKWENTLGVAAVDRAGRLARYSSRGPEVDIAAPGSDVTSCWLGGRYSTISGTSMATPLVSGVVALLIARHWDLGDASRTPLVTLADLREHLGRTAHDMDAPGHDHGTGWGLIKADRALVEVCHDDSRPPPVFPVFNFRGVRLFSPSQSGHKCSLDWGADADPAVVGALEQAIATKAS